MLGKIIKISLLSGFIWIGYQVLYVTPNQKSMREQIASRTLENSFAEGFEDITSERDLFNTDWSRWHELLLQQNTFSIRRSVKYCLIVPVDCITSSRLGNYIALDNKIRRRGDYSLKVFAQALEPGWFADSRVAIRKQLKGFGKNDHIYFSGWFYFEGPEDAQSSEQRNLNDLALLSFRAQNESLRTFGEPGAALFFSARNHLGFKIDNWLPAVEEQHQDLLNRLQMPLNRWVQIKVHLKLSDDERDGIIEIWIDDNKIMSENGQTLPTASTKYSILEIGAGSNFNKNYDQTFYIDNLYLSPTRFND